MLAAVTSLSAVADDMKAYRNDFSDPNEKFVTVGRGSTAISDGMLVSRDNYALFGTPDMKNYSVTFRARTPRNQEQVQIWSGFHAGNRFDRYVLGIKGGLINNMMLMRMGYKGNDELMAVRKLGFSPQPGEWIKVRIDVVGNVCLSMTTSCRISTLLTPTEISLPPAASPSAVPGFRLSSTT